jgi:hypothetical protein
LRELHEAYAWQVNAAIGEGREDIVRQLCDDFLEQALDIMAAGQTSVACLQPGCPTCAVLGRSAHPHAEVRETPFPPQRAVPAAETNPRRFQWLRRLFRA